MTFYAEYKINGNTNKASNDRAKPILRKHKEVYHTL